MRIRHLSLESIGPFVEADMNFYDDTDKKPRVVLITGENGTGKSIILDAIRKIFGSRYCELERDIARLQPNTQPPKIKIILEKEGFSVIQSDKSQNIPHRKKENKIITLLASLFLDNFIEVIPPEKYKEIADIPKQVQDGKIFCPNWIVDFWSSAPAGGSYKIDTLVRPIHQNFLINALQGKKRESDITQLICHFDYLRDSRYPREKEIGEHLYKIVEKIIEHSLLDGGKLSHVSRSEYKPVVIQNGQSVFLENLSGGNLYLIQNMVSLLGKMYSVNILRADPLSELCQTPGLLLIDEAENQLHPKWQKRFISTISDIFPNLQIIATTHSPFIISSVPDARLFVCKSKGDHCIVMDETAEYSNKPVDEILMSPLFEETLPFNEKISQLIKKREQAIQSGEQEIRDQIETELKAVNPEYFSYLDTDRLLEEIAGKGTETF